MLENRNWRPPLPWHRNPRHRRTRRPLCETLQHYRPELNYGGLIGGIHWKMGRITDFLQVFQWKKPMPVWPTNIGSEVTHLPPRYEGIQILPAKYYPSGIRASLLQGYNFLVTPSPGENWNTFWLLPHLSSVGWNFRISTPLLLLNAYNLTLLGQFSIHVVINPAVKIMHKLWTNSSIRWNYRQHLEEITRILVEGDVITKTNLLLPAVSPTASNTSPRSCPGSSSHPGFSLMFHLSLYKIHWTEYPPPENYWGSFLRNFSCF